MLAHNLIIATLRLKISQAVWATATRITFLVCLKNWWVCRQNNIVTLVIVHKTNTTNTTNTTKHKSTYYNAKFTVALTEQPKLENIYDHCHYKVFKPT